jgi:hypothetical protein
LLKFEARNLLKLGSRGFESGLGLFCLLVCSGAGRPRSWLSNQWTNQSISFVVGGAWWPSLVRVRVKVRVRVRVRVRVSVRVRVRARVRVRDKVRVRGWLGYLLRHGERGERVGQRHAHGDDGDADKVVGNVEGPCTLERHPQHHVSNF